MKALIALIAISLMVSSSLLVFPIRAQEPLNLTIKPDGSVEPSTDLLERNGTVYTFRGDVFGTIWVQRDNIIIDGAGHTLQGNGVETGQNTDIGILLGGPDLSRRECQMVLVKNLKISDIPRGIYSVGGSNNSFIGNYFDNSEIEIQGNANTTGNIIKHNTFINASISFDYNPNGTDIIEENNLINSTIWIWLAKAPIVNRNYWSNYTAQNPDAKELDNSGVWDTPYVYRSTGGGSHGEDPCIDYHPLVSPITDFEIPSFNSPLPASTPGSQHPTINTGAQQPQTEPLLTALVIAAIVSAVCVLGIGLLVYRKKRRML
jgi:hypothetical protein